MHARIFGRNVKFEPRLQRQSSAREAALEVPNPNATIPGLQRLACQMLESDAATPSLQNGGPDPRIGGDALLATRTCSADRVAQHLGVDRRTIHRGLVQEGETFSAIVDAVRRNSRRALSTSRHRNHLRVVASLLGFASPSGFSRWYRQHFKAKASAHRGARRAAND